ncbi:CehA/McbA family metallohydrolase, partial [Streptomyces sp. NPDC004752]
ALNLAAPPVRYQTGHPRSDEPQDWPPNAVAAAECRTLGATVSYAHPVHASLDDSGFPTEEVFAEQHAHLFPHARELVADAALGLVDSMDLTGNHTIWGPEAAEHLYHRLLGCGLRLAATAGTDTFLSHSRDGVASNPPGWSRAYAHLGDTPLSVGAWQDAVRAGRTFATNGPWLELDAAGQGLGDTVSLDEPQRVPVTARVTGVGVERLEIVGPTGVLAAVDTTPDAGTTELTADLDIAEPTWIAAVARGDSHPAVLGPQVYAHTSPVWIDVAGHTVARATDAAWCLDWLDRLETLTRKAGNFPHPDQLHDLVNVLDQARAFYRSITDRKAGRL